MNKIKFSFAVFALMVCGVSNAALVESAGNCQLNPDAVTITSIKSVFPVVGQELVSGGAINYTKCLGFITDPNNDWGKSPSPNLGGDEDGLLNGEILSQGQSSLPYSIPGEYFLTNDKDSMIDLDGDTVFDDPGWIRLGGSNEHGTITGGTWDFDYDFLGENDQIDLADLITMALNTDGTWSLEVKPNAIAAVTEFLGRPTVFDHLAFVMKGPNNSGSGNGNNSGPEYGSWAIYDFNFYDLIDSGLNISLGDTAYKFEGAWDIDMFNNTNALSHFSIWAHDPPATTTVVPEPSTLAIFALGMIGLVSRRFKKYL
jgi:hypothetical protein